MGVARSKIEDDKALLLCRERKRFVKHALQGRCSLAVAHVAYVQSLRNMGTALRKFVEPDAPVESSLYTSTSVTPEPLALTEKSISHFSYSPPSMSELVEPVEAHSPEASFSYSIQSQVNYMRTAESAAATVEERPAASATAKLMPGTTQNHAYHLPDNQPSFEALSPAHASRPWDYFSLNNPFQPAFSSQDETALSYGLNNADYVRRYREEEGIPDLEQDEERVSFVEREEYEASDDDYDKRSDSLSFQSSKKQNDGLDTCSPSTSPKLGPVRSTSRRINDLNREGGITSEKNYNSLGGEMHVVAALESMPSTVLPADGNKEMSKEAAAGNKLAAKEFFFIIKEIEHLFIKAYESGNEVPRMLEANKLHYRPLFTETKAKESSTSTYFASCFSCFEEPEHATPEPPTDAVRYLTWHRSASSRSSSSRIPLASTPKDNIEDGRGNLFNSFCMNSGSHASTLDRLYAWERKLYDEVKASGIIRKEYDKKCRLLRHQYSKAESSLKIDKTRAVVKDLHSRITVAIHRINSISQTIEELRDKELQPQLEELIAGLSRMWEMMLEYHKSQLNIISVEYNGSSKVAMHTESHRQATIHLENELNFVCSSFMKWIDAHKSYLQAVNGWLLKCVFPLQRKSSRGRQMPFSPRRYVAPPVFVTCRDWLQGLEGLEKKEAALVESIKYLVVVTTSYLPRQEKTHGKNAISTLASGQWKANDKSNTLHFHENEATAHWNSGFQSLHSSLVGFFSQLNDFADSSVKMYAILQKSMEEAHNNYSIRCQGGK